MSLEVSPDLAHDTAGTLAEARLLWKAVSRPNVMIKVPATPAGLPAIRTLISEGINVNVTLLFARDAYEAVADAFIAGLEARAAAGQPLGHVASVASFFVSRIDTAVDALLEEKLKSAEGEAKSRIERLLRQGGDCQCEAGVSELQDIFSGARWDAVRAKGAQTQRVLWASTGTKNPRYRDVLYVEELIGPDTVNTVPPATLTAFRDHGQPRASLEEAVADAATVLTDLQALGISLKKVTDDLLVEGVKMFVDAFAKLLKAVERRCREANTARINAQSHVLPSSLQAELTARLKVWDAQGGTRRLFAGDASLWTGQDEANWIGWLGDRGSRARRLEAAVRNPGGSADAAAFHRRCCSAWAAPASARKSGKKRSGLSRASPSSSSSTPPIPPRYGPSKRRSTSLARCSSSRASQAARSSPTSSRPTSSTA